MALSLILLDYAELRRLCSITGKEATSEDDLFVMAKYREATEETKIVGVWHCGQACGKQCRRCQVYSGHETHDEERFSVAQGERTTLQTMFSRQFIILL